MQITIRLPLKVGPDDRALLEEVGARFTASYNRVSRIAWDEQIRSGVDLHHRTYYAEKEASELPSQLVISARMKALESVKSARTRLKKGGKASCPKSKDAGVRYDARTYAISLEQKTASFTTLPGRKRLILPFRVPEVFVPYLGWQPRSAEIVQDSRGRFVLHLVVQKAVERPAPTGEVVGVDLGVNRPAVLSTNRFLGERRWKELERRLLDRRRGLQAKGTKSAKRRLNKLSGRLERFRRDCDHVLSRRIVESVDAGGTIVLEDLTDIRDRMRAGTAEHRRRLHGWSFAQLRGFVSYKADRAQRYAVFEDSAYTSQCCSRCGHTERANRATRSRFRCRACGFELDADLNASRNLESRGRAERATSLPSGSTSTGPEVSLLAPVG